jgi:cytochrome o ubiquinol oxidase subunit 1
MIISIPTGAKIFNWLFTMYHGRSASSADAVDGRLHGHLRDRRHDRRAAGRASGGLLLHNSLFLIAHFHNVIIGGVLFGLMAGITYWFPKAFGFAWCSGARRRSGSGSSASTSRSCRCTGLLGVTRRMNHFDDPSLQIWFQIAAFGALLIAIGIACFLIQLVVSFMRREELRDTTGDPWGGRTLEWSTSSPPPQYNFAFTPVVHDTDAWWHMKHNGFQRPEQGFIPIHMPKNTAAGIVLAGLSTICGFALIWHIWWLVIASFAATIITAIIHTFNYKRDYYISAEQVVRTEAARTQLMAGHG